MPVEFKLPDLGEGIHEAEIIEVLVGPGDKVEDGQTVLIVETDKAAAEMPSPVSGTVKEIRVKPGQTVRVGEVLIVFLKEGETGEQEAPPPPQKPIEERKTGPPGDKEKGAEAPGETARKAAGKTGEESRPVGPGAWPVPAAPSTRRVARELGVDINKVKPTGPGGRITTEDVRAFAQSFEITPGPPLEMEREQKFPPGPGEEAAAFKFEPEGGTERIPLRSVRRSIAKHLAFAWSQIPHVTHMDVADITQLEAFRLRHKSKVEAEGGVLSLTVFAVKAAAAALKKFPLFNSSIDMESEEIILKYYHNIGVAVDTGRGLLVPVIRNVSGKSIFDLAAELKTLSEKTRQGKASRDELSGATFTITNVGPLGGTAITPIINHPEVAILGMARARLQPVVRAVAPPDRVSPAQPGDEENYEIVPRLMLPLSITFDHRVLDGAQGARFLGTIIGLLEDPERLLMS